ncbi:MAG: hypothetical protein ABIZ36_09140, partial [Gemmatimonadaceae bacterium]
NGRVGAVATGSSLGLYIKAKGLLHYAIYSEGAWSEMHSINTTARITQESAIDAVRRLVSE